MKLWKCALVGLVLLLGAAPAPAALIAYEGFEYTPGTNLNGQNGGLGFSGPWGPGGFNASIFNHLGITTGSLTSGDLLTSGNRATSAAQNAIAGLTRALAQPIGADGTTRYLSFLLRPEGTLGGGAFNGFFGLTLERPGLIEPELFIGKPGSSAAAPYVLEERGGSQQTPSGVDAVAGQTVLLVVKLEFFAGNDRATLYVNPTPGGPEPASGTVLQTSDFASPAGLITGLTVYSTGAFSIDEIRLGETFADVTPVNPAVVPEPATLVLAAPGLFALGLAALRRVRGRARREG